jgi:chemotaxis protein methyltransferase CheR
MTVPPEESISPQALAFLAALVHERCGIRLGPDRRALVESRLGRRLRSLGLARYEEYCDLLRSARAEDEIGELVDLITTNHTFFFREKAHFEILAREVLPRLVERRGRSEGPLRVWSAGASSGEEAYTLAIVLAEFARTRPAFDWRIVASDLSRRMLERCRSGIYQAGRVNLPETGMLPRYFQRGFGAREGCYRVKRELRMKVDPQPINLFRQRSPFPTEQDVIFCRNVMIYFDPEDRAELVRRLTEHLAPGGTLFVGHAESLFCIKHGLRMAWPSVYVKPG